MTSWLLRARRERPRRGRAAECGKQLPPSDGDCHAPLPREVRKSNDTTPLAGSLHVRGGGCWLLRPQSSALNCTTPANAAIAASPVALLRLAAFVSPAFKDGKERSAPAIP